MKSENESPVENASDFTPGRPLRLYDNHNHYSDMSTDSLVGYKMNGFKGWTCGLGVESLTITMDGDIQGASCQVGGVYGNIYEGFTAPKLWSLCPKEICSCGADLFIPKAQRPADKEKLLKTLEKSSRKHLYKVAKMRTAPVALERTHDSSIKQVYWELGRRCNYDCSYCWPDVHSATEKHKSFETMAGAVMLVDEHFCAGKKAHFIISGGEPTMNPRFMDLVKFIHSMGHNLSIHSNGFHRPSYYEEIISYTNLNLSAHFEFFRPQKFIEVVRAVTARKVAMDNKGVGHLEVKIMMSPRKRQMAIDLEKDLLAIPGFKEYCMIAIVPIRNGNNLDRVMAGYTPEDEALFGERL